MKTTAKERNEARKGCHFFYNRICVLDSCYCLKELRERNKKKKP